MLSCFSMNSVIFNHFLVSYYLRSEWVQEFLFCPLRYWLFLLQKFAKHFGWVGKKKLKNIYILQLLIITFKIFISACTLLRRRQLQCLPCL